MIFSFSVKIMTTNTISNMEKIASPTTHKVGGCGFDAADAQELTSNLITMMGGSFVLGVMLTTFILLVLDFLRRNVQEEE